MRRPDAVRLAVALGMLFSAGGCLSSVKTSSPEADAAGAALERRDLSEAAIRKWSPVSALAARRLMEEYGPPDEVRADRLAWTGNKPWRRTVVLDSRDPRSAIIQQTIDYSMNLKQSVDVAAFDDRLSFDERNRELTSYADSEEHNFLRVNLADDVARERLRPEQARDMYEEIVSFQASGKTSPYLRGLNFAPGATRE